MKKIDFYSTEVQNILRTISSSHNLLIVFNKSEPDNKRFFIVTEFVEGQNYIEKHTLIGQDITPLFLDNMLLQTMGAVQYDQPSFNLQRQQTFDTKLDMVQKKKYYFSKDYSWEFWLSD